MIRPLARLWVLALVVGCVEPAPESVTLRLVDVVDEAEVRWPRQRPRRLPDGIGGPRTFRMLRAERVGRMAMFPRPRDGDSRLSLLAPSGTRYDFGLDLPEETELRLALGYLPPEEATGPPIRFSVFVTTAEGGGGVLLDEEIPTRSDGDWLERRLDLSAWGGQRVNLTLQTRAASDQGQLWAAWANPEIVRIEAPEAGTDVVLISLDTLRADRLGCYGYERPTSPSLDALAERSVRFATAVSQAPWTRPSHDSMFSGLYPSARGREEAPVLAERLHDLGFRTEALTGGGQMDFRLGFARGFDAYRVFDWINDLDEVARWLDGSAGRQRFLFLHTYEIHDPYTHDEFVSAPIEEGIAPVYSKSMHQRLRDQLTDEQKRMVSDLYDGGIAFTDRELGRLFELFESRGVFERAIVVVTSDHGEQFWEHGGWRHGMNLYDHQLLVPLIVYLPPSLERRVGGRAGLAGRVVERQVRLVDLVPTLMDLLEAPVTGRLDGRSLVPLLAGDDLGPVDAFSERLNVKFKEAKALRSEKYKFIFSFPKEAGVGRVPEATELYDLTRDPGEQHNLAAERPEVVEDLDAKLRTLLDLLADPSELEDEDPANLDPDLRERLEALGYIG